jgi:hypothetical protein
MWQKGAREEGKKEPRKATHYRWQILHDVLRVTHECAIVRATPDKDAFEDGVFLFELCAHLSREKARYVGNLNTKPIKAR